MSLDNINALNNRVWYVEGGVRPDRPPEMLYHGKFSTDPTHTLGEATRVTVPDPNHFGRDKQIGTVPGSVTRASFSLARRYLTDEGILKRWANEGCRVDIFALSGKCGNPQDFSEGGEKHTYFPDGRISTHGFENFGAFGTDENNPTNEMVDMTSETYYELLQMGMEQFGSASTTRELWTVDVYKGDDCEDCPDKCGRVLITMAGTAATPGTQPLLLYSDNSGETISTDIIDTLFSNENVVDSAIIGGDLVLLSKTGNELHWTRVVDIFEGINTWNQTASGFVVGSEPNAMSSADVRHTWIAGDSGYIYFVKNHKVEVEVQEAGTLTSQHLQAIHALNKENVLAVGESNAVLYTHNGGVTWESVTGPAAGVTLGACWMWDEDIWLIGEGSGGSGILYLTVNGGRTWSQIGLPATYTRIDKIEFVSEAEGYISARSGGQSYILRTITAGNEWYVLPQGLRAVALDNSYLSDLAVCEPYSNTVYAVGLADNGTAGFAARLDAIA